MPYFIKTGFGSIVAMLLFIPLLILMTIFIPVLIVIILMIAAAVGITALLLSRTKKAGKKQESQARKAKGIIDVEYKVK